MNKAEDTNNDNTTPSIPILPSYTYDFTKLNDGSLNQMRFELGDTEVCNGKYTTALCDEEYLALIVKAKEHGKSWEYAKLYCLECILMKFSMQSDYSGGGISIQLSNRRDFWYGLYKDMKKRIKTTYPKFNDYAIGKGQPNHGHYFYFGMHDNFGGDIKK